jgi:hypothetical protein
MLERQREGGSLGWTCSGRRSPLGLIPHSPDDAVICGASDPIVV